MAINWCSIIGICINVSQYSIYIRYTLTLIFTQYIKNSAKNINFTRSIKMEKHLSFIYSEESGHAREILSPINTHVFSILSHIGFKHSTKYLLLLLLSQILRSFEGSIHCDTIHREKKVLGNWRTSSFDLYQDNQLRIRIQNFLLCLYFCHF